MFNDLSEIPAGGGRTGRWTPILRLQAGILNRFTIPPSRCWLENVMVCVFSRNRTPVPNKTPPFLHGAGLETVQKGRG